MSTDDFEKKLQRQQLRKIPADWRDLILQTTRESALYASSPPKPVLWRVCLTTWHELIQPCRYAWLSMAALWLFFWMVNSQTGPSKAAPQMVASTPRPSEQFRFFQEQRQALAELTDPPRLSPAAAPQQAHPKPRSERDPLFRRS